METILTFGRCVVKLVPPNPFVTLEEGMASNLVGISPNFGDPFQLTNELRTTEQAMRTRIDEKIRHGEEKLKEGQESESEDIISSSDDEDVFAAIRSKILMPNPDASESSEENKDASNKKIDPSKPIEAPISIAHNPLLSQFNQGSDHLQPYQEAPIECYDWVEYKTQDGSNQLYYHSASLNKTSWEAPLDFLRIKENKERELAANIASSQVAKEVAKHSHPGKHSGNPFFSENETPQQLSQTTATMNPFMQPTTINPFQPSLQSHVSTRLPVVSSVNKPPNHASVNPFASNTNNNPFAQAYDQQNPQPHHSYSQSSLPVPSSDTPIIPSGNPFI